MRQSSSTCSTAVLDLTTATGEDRWELIGWHRKRVGEPPAGHDCESPHSAPSYSHLVLACARP